MSKHSVMVVKSRCLMPALIALTLNGVSLPLTSIMIILIKSLQLNSKGLHNANDQFVLPYLSLMHLFDLKHTNIRSASKMQIIQASKTALQSGSTSKMRGMTVQIFSLVTIQIEET